MIGRGSSIGGLNVFLAEEGHADPVTGQMYADLATLAVLQASNLPADHLSARVHEAVLPRSVIEQAKGVLAYQRGVDLDTAYSALRDEAEQQHETVTGAATRIVDEAYRA